MEEIRVQFASTKIPDMSGIVVQAKCSFLQGIENNGYFVQYIPFIEGIYCQAIIFNKLN